MSIKKPIILYERGVVQKIAKSFKCDDKTVRDALKFITESELSERIRQEALKYYGCILVRRPVMKTSKTEKALS